MKKTGMRVCTWLLAVALLLPLCAVPAKAEEILWLSENFDGAAGLAGTKLTLPAEDAVTGEAIVGGCLKVPFTAENNDKKICLQNPAVSAGDAQFLVLTAKYIISSDSADDSVDICANRYTFAPLPEGTSFGTWLGLVRLTKAGACYPDGNGTMSRKGLHALVPGEEVNLRLTLDMENGIFYSFLNGELDFSGQLYTRYQNSEGKWVTAPIAEIGLPAGSLIPANPHSTGADPDAFFTLDDIWLIGGEEGEADEAMVYAETDFSDGDEAVDASGLVNAGLSEGCFRVPFYSPNAGGCYRPRRYRKRRSCADSAPQRDCAARHADLRSGLLPAR